MFRTSKETWLTGPGVRSAAKKYLPNSALNAASRTMLLSRILRRSRGKVQRHCPVCDYRGGFMAFGDPPRYDAQCPSCHSAERHRLLKLWLDRNRQDKLGEVIHFAPEDCLKDVLRKMARDYKTVDIRPGRADLVLNIEKMALPDQSVDCVVCLHVLEHVNDVAALTEIYRVLRRGGFAILMVPIVEGWAATYENPDVKTDAEREQHFAQFDHVRMYGADFRDRVRAAGFVLDEYTAVEPDVQTYGLLRGEKIFVARKGNKTG